jgi:hypothetical protein
VLYRRVAEVSPDSPYSHFSLEIEREVSCVLAGPTGVHAFADGGAVIFCGKCGHVKPKEVYLLNFT